MFLKRVAYRAFLEAIDLVALRFRFAELMERAAYWARWMGHEQDDSLVERALICVVPGVSHEIVAPLEWLSDRELLIRDVQKTLSRLGVGGSASDDAGPGAIDPGVVEVTALQVRLLIEAWLNPAGGLRPL